MTHLSRSLILGCSMLALAACGPEDLGSPGANGDINVGDINIGGGGGNPTPTPTPGTGVTPASGCPTLTGGSLEDSGTISGPTGTYRVCTLPSQFTANANLPYVEGLLYAMNGRVDVGVDDGPTDDNSDGITGTTVNLGIDPGVIIYSTTGRSYMVVHRGSTIEADGLADRPIIFTSRDDVLGLNNNTSSQQWGGLVLLGRAPVSDCSGAPNTPQVDCQQELEGDPNPPSFGGDTPDDNSGILRYVQLRYSGFTLASGSELQSLTTGGVGSETVIDYVQSYNSSDDGVELFGGVTNLRHFIVVGSEDDSFDIDSGAKADIQYAIAVQRAGAGDRAIELDSPDADFTINAVPRTNARFSNFTFWAAGGGDQAVAVRGATDLTLVNGLIVKPNGNCVSVNGDEAAAGRGTDDEAGPPAFHSVGFDCSADDSAQVLGYINDGTGNDLGYTHTLTANYLNGANEMGSTPIFDPTTLSSFFEATDFIGAMAIDDDWTQGWTCDSATVSFGSGNSCQSLPVYD